MPQNFTSMNTLKALLSFTSHVSQDEEHVVHVCRFPVVVIGFIGSLNIFVSFVAYHTYKKVTWVAGFDSVTE